MTDKHGATALPTLLVFALMPRPTPRAARGARQGEKAVELGKQQRPDVELRHEYAALDQAHDLRRRHELHRDARLRREAGGALARCDEEIVDAVVEAAGAGRVLAQRMDRARGEAGLLQELAPAAFGRVLAGIDEARRQFPGVGLERG